MTFLCELSGSCDDYDSHLDSVGPIWGGGVQTEILRLRPFAHGDT